MRAADLYGAVGDHWQHVIATRESLGATLEIQKVE
jgi:hypothetical protein